MKLFNTRLSLLSLAVLAHADPFLDDCPYAATQTMAIAVEVTSDNLDSCDGDMPIVMKDFVADQVALKVGSTPMLNESILSFDICDDQERKLRGGNRHLQRYYLFFGGGSKYLYVFFLLCNAALSCCHLICFYSSLCTHIFVICRHFSPGCMFCGTYNDARLLNQADDVDGRALSSVLNIDERIELETVLSEALTSDAGHFFVADVNSCLFGDTSLTMTVTLTEEVVGTSFCE